MTLVKGKDYIDSVIDKRQAVVPVAVRIDCSAGHTDAAKICEAVPLRDSVDILCKICNESEIRCAILP